MRDRVLPVPVPTLTQTSVRNPRNLSDFLDGDRFLLQILARVRQSRFQYRGCVSQAVPVLIGCRGIGGIHGSDEDAGAIKGR
jgi:hypothetical protein